MSKISAFIPFVDKSTTQDLIRQLFEFTFEIFVLTTRPIKDKFSNASTLLVDHLNSSSTIRLISEKATADYILVSTLSTKVNLGVFALERFLQIAEATNAGIIYSDYIEVVNQVPKPHPTIDYQLGSIRNDFDFGPILFIDSAKMKNALIINSNYKYAGLYDLRLKLSQSNLIMRVPEFLCSISESDNRSSGEKQFDYVDPRNRVVQIEMEQANTEYLKNISAFLKPNKKEIQFDGSTFKTEASIIIPVKNRVRTIKDAVNSALTQKTNFRFNVIVVDNYSTDGTTEILQEYSREHKNLIHVIPERNDLLIGGCWNEAVHNLECGRFAVQLDSDDVYKDERTLQIIIDTFKKEKCAMVIGSYILTDFNLNKIPPGLIDHAEWTSDNGPNNAMRINGLGAPRAFYTPLLRSLKIPNVSYGEDYFLGITISRDYKIGRIFEPIYYCRRWEENTDSALDIQKQNLNNTYKDRLRTVEILSRQKKNFDK
jgi:hypothetical protein